MGAMLREHKMGVTSVAFNPAEVAAATTVEQTVALPGLRPTDFGAVSKPTVTAGLSLGGARCSAADTLALTFINATAGAVDAGLETYLVFWMRAECIDAMVVSP
jgi:hypothetical protein